MNQMLHHPLLDTHPFHHLYLKQLFHLVHHLMLSFLCTDFTTCLGARDFRDDLFSLINSFFTSFCTSRLTTSCIIFTSAFLVISNSCVYLSILCLLLKNPSNCA